MRLLGLDYGSVTIGVAISDALNLTAGPLETIKRTSENKLRRSLARIEEIIAENDVEKIVIGLPLNTDGSMGERAWMTYEFKEKLEKRVGLPIVMWDERLSTWEANNILDETNFKADRKKRKEIIDQLAAVLILDSYMKFAANGGKDEDLAQAEPNKIPENK